MVYFTKIELDKPQKPKIAQNAHSGPWRTPKMVFSGIFDLKIGFSRLKNILEVSSSPGFQVEVKKSIGYHWKTGIFAFLCSIRGHFGPKITYHIDRL